MEGVTLNNDGIESYNREYYDKYWSGGVELYDSHPTSRHRRRFVVNSVAKIGVDDSAFIFDYGCGTAAALSQIRTRFGLRDAQLGGCDISGASISRAKTLFPSGFFVEGSFPSIDRPIDIAVCSEVIEHTSDYRAILDWLFEHLRQGGSLILTTPHVPMDPPDVSYGHAQHFKLASLVEQLQSSGFRVVYARRWGWPLFTIQKWFTKHFFRAITENVIESAMTPSRRFLFRIVYVIYFIHDLFPMGPQILIRCEKP